MKSVCDQGSLHDVSQRFLQQTLDKKLMSNMRVSWIRYQSTADNLVSSSALCQCVTFITPGPVSTEIVGR